MNGSPAAAHWYLWGKTDSKGSGGYHPLFCHMVDVGAVARKLWQDCLPLAARLEVARALDMSEQESQAWVALLAGLHDLGKASPAFASQDPTSHQRIAQAGLKWPANITPIPHGVITAFVLPCVLADMSVPGPVARRIATIAGGHHGVLPTATDVSPHNVILSAIGDRSWRSARLDLAQTVAKAFGIPSGKPPSSLPNSTAMILAGLISVADWIGSSAEHFPLAVPDPSSPPVFDPAKYLDTAERLAEDALHSLRWSGWEPSAEAAGFSQLFPHLGGPPRPVQEAVMKLADQIRGPSLVLIEAPMGEGKTEAAMYLADYWGTRQGQRGCYFALPTMAMSNQMFSRVREFLGRRYGSQVVNLQLLHGHASLSAEFRALRLRADHLLRPYGVGEQKTPEGDSPNVVAAEWFTYRKRGLLAPFGVGTVDQALMAALRTRHVFVRLFGLAHKTVIIDEVHAYDTYMSVLLERLLTWLAALGSSVVLLSATLPDVRRRALAAAYFEGLQSRPAPAELPAASYPRITWLAPSGQGAKHVAAAQARSQTVRVRWVDGQLPPKGSDEPFTLGEQLKKALGDEGCAVVICNTVSRAQRVYRALKHFFPGNAGDGKPVLDLFHARFAVEDRDEREKRCLVRFGKPNKNEKVEVEEGEVVKVDRPKLAVLVATQVVEQSLDLDFDLMVTDMAPVDLVLQRLGRLWRHERKRRGQLVEPWLWICRAEQNGDGVPSFDPGTSAVYDKHVLLRSWLALGGRTEIRVPGDVECLIESVYAERECPPELSQPIRVAWQSTWQKHRLQVEAEGHEAKERWLQRPDWDRALWHFTQDWREEDAPQFHQKHQALTRLSRPSVTVVCLYGSPERPSIGQDGTEPVDLYAEPSTELAIKLLRRSVSVTHQGVVHSLLAQMPPPGWRKSPLLRHCRLVTLGPDNRALLGAYRFHLSNEYGLTIEGPDEEGD